MKQKGFAPILIILIVLVVGVGAYFLGTQKDKFSQLQISFNSPTPQTSTIPATTPDPTANWKTFTSTVHNLTFKYPTSWVIDPNNNYNDETNAIFKINKAGSSITMYFNLDGIGGLGKDYDGTPFNLSGISLYKYSYEDKTFGKKIVGLTDELKNSLGVFRHNGKTFSITITYPSNLSVTEEKNLLDEFDQVLSTFKFTK